MAPRRLNLRQVEALKAVIECGTVSRAAELLNISQSAMSKLIAHLEDDTGLSLFDRVKGRLTPTRRGMRLYEEIDRIFAGVRQVENAVEAIRRDEQSRLVIGVMPALSGSFIQMTTLRFLERQPGVFCTIRSLGSQWISEGLISRKLDVGLVITPLDNPDIDTEPLMARPVVCILPRGHRLATQSVITPADLDGVPFVSFEPESATNLRVSGVLTAHGATPKVVMVVNISPTLCELVAAGVGVSLVHPLIVGGLRDKLVIRPFEPAVNIDFQLCRPHASRDVRVAKAFVDAARETAAEIARTILSPD